MDPISIGLGVVGLGMSIFGSVASAGVAKQQAQQNQAIAADEQKINAQKEQAMQLQSRRQQLEVLRNAQRARAMATNAAVSQGAQFGSGLEGGLAQVSDDATSSLRGIGQNLEIGENIFGINNDISSHKMQLASLGGEMATDQGIASLGGSILKSSGTIGAFGKQLGSMNFTPWSGTPSPGGYG